MLLLSSLLATPAAGDALITDLFNPDPLDFRADVTVGYGFRTPLEPLLVTHLGVWDQDQDGLDSAVDVALWTISGDLLRELTIAAGAASPLRGDFRYEPLSVPFTLQPNTDYVLGAYQLPGVPYSSFNTDVEDDFTISPGFNRLEERASSVGGGEGQLTFPLMDVDRDQAYIGPNLIFTDVPEPRTLALGILGWAAALPSRRIRRVLQRPPF